MECKFDIKLIHDYAENNIGELETIFVEEHLKYCEKCNKELKILRNINSGLKDAFSEMDFPDRLSIISELIVENCISQVALENSKLKITEYIKDYQNRRKASEELTKVYANNPYNNFLKTSVNNSVNYVKKPVESYLKKKISSIKLFNFIKIG